MKTRRSFLHFFHIRLHTNLMGTVSGMASLMANMADPSWGDCRCYVLSSRMVADNAEGGRRQGD
jgi:hypothetical protein